MMTSKSTYTEAYVWIWLPGNIKPVVAGKLTSDENNLVFNYGKSYLERDNAIAIYDKELPLQSGIISPLSGLNMPGCIRDSAPDAWGRRVIINRKLAKTYNDIEIKKIRTINGIPIEKIKTINNTYTNINNVQLDELTYLLESGSDRIGALDFQLSPTHYEPRFSNNVSLEELLESAMRVESGIPLTPELDQAIHHGSSIGGARPKALIEDKDKKYIAKFSSSSDLYSVVKAEFIAMRLAKIAGLNVAPVTLTKASHKDVLLIERFDRIMSNHEWQRKLMLSALTILELDEMMARYASYEDLAEIIRYRFTNAKETLKELFSRIVFNIICGNTDDHARNHAAFWDGEMLTLTPAYDICPQGRSGNEASQAMLINDSSRMSQISLCINAAEKFLLSRKEAISITEKQISSIIKNWSLVCDEAELNETDRKLLWGRQFLNPYAFLGLDKDSNDILNLAKEVNL